MKVEQFYQMPLSIRFRDEASFDSYYAAGNELICDSLKKVSQGVGEPSIYLWGSGGVGCSHLLKACCHAAELHGRSSAYLPLSELVHFDTEVLRGMERFDLVCLDNIQAIAGNTQWQEAIFHLFNGIRQLNNHLVMAGCGIPANLGISLPDLASRLNWGLVIQVQGLSDEDKLKALQKIAASKGVELAEDASRYLLYRASRNMTDLSNLLEELDQASLCAQRKVTIPFIKEVTGL